jgi:hypothetical protein
LQLQQALFISTCANIAGGDPIQHVWLRQLQPVDMYEEPEYQFITHNCPQAAQLYYSAVGKKSTNITAVRRVD